MEKRLVMIIACFLLGLSLFLVGPSRIIPLPESLKLMVIGQFLVGFIMPFAFVPGLSDMTEAVMYLFSKS